MKKIKKLTILLSYICLIFLVYTNLNCKRFAPKEISEKSIKKKLLKKHKIEKGWIELDLIHTFPTKNDEKKGYFFYLPSHMELDDQRFIYVVDSRLHKILKFSKDGEYLDEFAKLGQGPGEFYFPHMIRISKDKKLYIRDGSGRMQVLNSCGKYITGFKVYHVIHDFIISDNGYIYANCIYGEIRKENPLIIKFNMTGEIIDSFGDRIDIKDHRTRDSEVFLAQLKNEIIVVFVHYPIIQRFSMDGKLKKEFRLNLVLLNELEKYNYKKWFTNPNPYKVMLPRLVAGIRILNQRIFILLQLPRIEILELNREGNLTNFYYSTAVKNAVSFWGFIVREERHRLLFYILQSSEEGKLYIFQSKK